MDHQVQAPTAKTGNLGSVSETHMVGEKEPLQIVLWLSHACDGMNMYITHTHTHKYTNVSSYLFKLNWDTITSDVQYLLNFP